MVACSNEKMSLLAEWLPVSKSNGPKRAPSIQSFDINISSGNIKHVTILPRKLTLLEKWLPLLPLSDSIGQEREPSIQRVDTNISQTKHRVQHKFVAKNYNKVT
jgi:hypothetical protein